VPYKDPEKLVDPADLGTWVVKDLAQKFQITPRKAQKIVEHMLDLVYRDITRFAEKVDRYAPDLATTGRVIGARIGFAIDRIVRFRRSVGGDEVGAKPTKVSRRRKKPRLALPG
jgi:hypothetical protein